MPEGVKSNVSGVILAGGMGTRLRPITYYIQKCMIPIGSLQKPLLEYIVLLMKNHGINNVNLLVNYKHEQIVNYFNITCYISSSKSNCILKTFRKIFDYI